MTKQLHCEIPDKTHEEIRKEAFKKKTSMSKLVVEAWNNSKTLSTGKDK